MLGEHTVLHGSAAYAVPLRRYSARVELRTSSSIPHRLPTDVGIHSSFDFGQWAAFAKTSEVLQGILDFDRWEKEADQLGVYADIPIGYGLGSSGAITAAVFRRFTNELSTSLEKIRIQLAALEGFFHGKSSGLDPLVSFLDKAIFIDPSGQIEPVEVTNPFPVLDQQGGWFLLDSGQPRAGKDAISRFGESCKNEQWRQEVLKPMNQLVLELAEGLKDEKCDGLTVKLASLSHLQLEELKFLIPPHIERIWKSWLLQGTAYLKLCGAGGGGFFLGYAPNRAMIKLEVLWL